MALIYDDSGIISFHTREKVNVCSFGIDEYETFIQINVIYRFCLTNQEHICIPSIQPKAVMHIRYADMHDGVKIAIIYGTHTKKNIT